MHKQNQELFVDANKSAVLLEQFVGKRRFQIFIKEARDKLDSIQFREWTPDSMIDYISAEMRKPNWVGKQPSVSQFEKMVKESRRRCRELQVELHHSHSTMFIQRAHSEDEFDLAKIHLIELLDFYDQREGTSPPELFLSILGRKYFSEIKIVGVLAGVCLGFEFNKVGTNAEET